MYTPPEAVQYILPYLPKDKVYREACYGEWHFAGELRRHWHNVVWHKDIDCLISEPKENWDIWITNPPFNGNKKFIRRAIELWKPFVFLIRLEHLGWVEAAELFRDMFQYNNGWQIIIPPKRINYITPKMMKWEKVWGSPFHSIFLLNGFKESIYEQTIIYL